MNDKFYYNEGELLIGESQCDFCIYKNNKNKDICEKYPEGKPQGVVDNMVACEKQRTENYIDLDEE